MEIKRVYVFEDMVARIKQLKKRLKYTNKTLSEASGISLGTLSKMLANKHTDCTTSNIEALAKTFDVSMDFLVYGIDEKTLESFSQKYAVLDEADKEKARIFLDGLLAQDKYKLVFRASHTDDNSKSAKIEEISEERINFLENAPETNEII